jgi:hypothetical protein
MKYNRHKSHNNHQKYTTEEGSNTFTAPPHNNYLSAPRRDTTQEKPTLDMISNSQHRHVPNAGDLLPGEIGQHARTIKD